MIFKENEKTIHETLSVSSPSESSSRGCMLDILVSHMQNIKTPTDDRDSLLFPKKKMNTTRSNSEHNKKSSIAKYPSKSLGFSGASSLKKDSQKVELELDIKSSKSLVNLKFPKV